MGCQWLLGIDGVVTVGIVSFAVGVQGFLGMVVSVSDGGQGWLEMVIGAQPEVSVAWCWRGLLEC